VTASVLLPASLSRLALPQQSSRTLSRGSGRSQASTFSAISFDLRFAFSHDIPALRAACMHSVHNQRSMHAQTQQHSAWLSTTACACLPPREHSIVVVTAVKGGDGQAGCAAAIQVHDMHDILALQPNLQCMHSFPPSGCTCCDPCEIVCTVHDTRAWLERSAPHSEHERSQRFECSRTQPMRWAVTPHMIMINQ
jgi:hypothetical protein